MSTNIAEQWLCDCADTANNKNLDAHMDLISKRVSLTGIPGFESIGYEQWYQQCKHEFENNIIKKVRYQNIKLIASTDDHVMFKTFETVEATDGEVNAQGVEMLLEKEGDNVVVLNDLAWRLRDKEPSRALELAERAANLAPDLAPVLDTLAVVLLKNGDIDQAKQKITRAYRLMPKHVPIRFHYAEIYAAAGDKVSAIEKLESLLDEGEDFPEKAEAERLLNALK